MMKAKLMGIPAGRDGTFATLKLMRGLVRKYKADLSIRLLAQKITRKLPEKNYTLEAVYIHAFVRDKIRYVKDVNGIETLQTPVNTIKIGSGDCDDKSILVASLLESIGHPTRFIACGFLPDTFSHVFVQTKIGTKWIGVETTEKWPLGRFPPNIVNKLIVRN